ncbi:MAG: hypothetical protein JWQ90_4401 [Hydrocarboniphaga sp.]|uniref:hypothetical protein n=1 Tax=Hydrocarboniphaga sp. TaxID=2033016 RepID=UPI00261F4FDF|nr:hypothetical protein [Hydrocarboniphaga sp.]MDB5971951.1 hypothetical protein [Hydrocarboniphaga sp.]
MRNPLLAKLRFNYLWSNPQADNDVLVAAALERPLFPDLLTLSLELGPDALRRVWDEIEAEGWRSPTARDMSSRYIGIIDRAYRKAAGPYPQPA